MTKTRREREAGKHRMKGPSGKSRGGNEIPKEFLRAYWKGTPQEVRHLPLRLGFLKLEYGIYGNADELSLVSFVLSDSGEAIAVGPRLEFLLDGSGKDGEVTYIPENGVSGLQWSGGHVIWGHTYDDDSAPGKGREVGLDRWIYECVWEMINPGDEAIAERKRLDEEEGV